jgi:hypothetical protein
MAIKVVIQNAVLRGSHDDRLLQRVATTYFDGREYRVFAPSKATGNPVEWIEHLQVRQQSEDGQGENIITDGRKNVIISKVMEELEKHDLDADIWRNVNSSGRYCAAQICLRGHVHSIDGADYKQDERCPQCGEPCIDRCPTCKAPIRGALVYSKDYTLAFYCYKCGHQYPWMEDRLGTAKELLNHDDKLTLDEREKLWGLLQYVMSDPKSDLVPAKKKLIQLALGNALPATRDFMLEFMAKYAAEMSK